MLNVHTSVGQVSKMKWELVRSSSRFSPKPLSDITYNDIQVDIRHAASHWDENRPQKPCLKKNLKKNTLTSYLNIGRYKFQFLAIYLGE
jgi:hypothetical protein